MKHWLLAFLILTVVPLSAAATLNVVATHAVLAEIAAQVGADAINVTTLIPSGFCPAHYDLSPSDYAALISADLVLYSGFEPWVEQLSGDTQPDALIQLAGSWNTPGAAAQLASAIADVLSERLPDASDTFHSNSEDYAQELAAIDQTLSERAAALDVSGTPVICMAWQAEFVSWLGFDVAVTYGIPENLSVRDLIDLAQRGKAVDAQLVIDNLQSGIEFGAKLAREINAVHVVLSNFPGALPKTATLLDLFVRNADALFSAIEPIE